MASARKHGLEHFFGDLSGPIKVEIARPNDVSPRLDHLGANLNIKGETMPSNRLKPWIEPNDFEAFRQSAVDHLNLPNTYDEWLQLAAQEEAKLGAGGITLKKVVVHPDEFATYCLASGLQQNAVAFGAFAVAKSRQQEKC